MSAFAGLVTETNLFGVWFVLICEDGKVVMKNVYGPIVTDPEDNRMLLLWIDQLRTVKKLFGTDLLNFST